MKSKSAVGVQSAIRALVPILVVIVGLHQAGVIHAWKDLVSFDTIMAILAGLLAKGVLAAATAKDVQVR